MIIYICGIQGSGKTTLCNVLRSILVDIDYDKKVVAHDMDIFVKYSKDQSSYFDKKQFDNFMMINKYKTIILCGLLGHLKHVQLPSNTLYRYIELNATLLKKNCVYRFYNQYDIYNFLTKPLLEYLQDTSDICESNINERLLKDSVYFETFNIDIVRFQSFSKLIQDILSNMEINGHGIDTDKYLKIYLRKLSIKNYSIITLKIILLFLYFLPSYIMKSFRFNIWMPVYYFFFPQFKILDSINLLFLISLLKRHMKLFIS